MIWRQLSYEERQGYGPGCSVFVSGPYLIIEEHEEWFASASYNGEQVGCRFGNDDGVDFLEKLKQDCTDHAIHQACKTI
jgi:hypothetical protein